jgi:hypothetical protein
MVVVIELQMFEDERPVTSSINPYFKPRTYVSKQDRENRASSGVGPDGLLDAKLIQKPNFEPLLLAACNSHPLDNTIRMTEEDHKYYVRWELHKPDISVDSISVSKLIDDHFPKFMGLAVAQNMTKDKNGHHIGKYQGLNLTDEQLVKKWEDSNKVPRDTGTMVHFIIECFLNGMDINPFMQFKVIRHFLAWYKKDILDQGWIPFRTEFRMRSDAELRLTGTTDAMFVSKSQKPGDVLKIKMVDWKFTEGVTKWFGKFGYGPCLSMKDRKYEHYGVQQWCYKRIFEDNYAPYDYNGTTYQKVELVKMDLLLLHDTFDEAHPVSMDNPTDNFKNVVNELFAERRMMLRENRK